MFVVCNDDNFKHFLLLFQLEHWSLESVPFEKLDTPKQCCEANNNKTSHFIYFTLLILQIHKNCIPFQNIAFSQCTTLAIDKVIKAYLCRSFFVFCLLLLNCLLRCPFCSILSLLPNACKTHFFFIFRNISLPFFYSCPMYVVQQPGGRPPLFICGTLSC